MATRSKPTYTPRLAIKFLVSNSLAGSLIGAGGSAIRELIEVTEARVTVSSVQEVYPGTNDRIILVSGSHNSVDLTQNLLWDMFALNASASAAERKTITWSPRATSATPGEYDEIEVSAKIAVSASAGGLVLGRGGATLRSIAEESGAKVQMTSKEDAVFTQERILTISGTTGSCARCVTLILTKLGEDLEAAQYANRGVTYAPQIPGFNQNRNPRGPNGRNGSSDSAPAEDASGISSTKITLTVPDGIVGNILGKQGSTMREIMSLSGAKITVSSREDAKTTDGEIANRTVTITGSPTAAQTAHAFITQKLQAPSTGRGRRTKGESKEADGEAMEEGDA